MLNSWEAHFRCVHVLKFTSDDAALISASEDSSVSVWSVAWSVNSTQFDAMKLIVIIISLVDNQLQHELPVPYCNLPDHTLPVLDLACGSGLFPDFRLVTCSQDHTVKVPCHLLCTGMISNLKIKDMGFRFTVPATTRDIYITACHSSGSYGPRATGDICRVGSWQHLSHQFIQVK
jgi:WD40 repeat protein